MGVLLHADVSTPTASETPNPLSRGRHAASSHLRLNSVSPGSDRPSSRRRTWSWRRPTHAAICQTPRIRPPRLQPPSQTRSAILHADQPGPTRRALALPLVEPVRRDQATAEANAARNEGFGRAVSERALTGLQPMRGSFAHSGTRPQRGIESRRRPSRSAADDRHIPAPRDVTAGPEVQRRTRETEEEVGQVPCEGPHEAAAYGWRRYAGGRAFHARFGLRIKSPPGSPRLHRGRRTAVRICRVRPSGRHARRREPEDRRPSLAGVPTTADGPRRRRRAGLRRRR